MSFFGLGSKVAERISPSPPTWEESIAEAQSNRLGKTTKLDVAHDAILTEDFYELAAEDRADKKAAMERYLGYANKRNAKGKGGKMAGDFIVCDDYRKGSPWGMVAVATAALAAGGWALTVAMLPDNPSVMEDTDTTRAITIEPYTPELTD
jgi:hypothetical protein